MMQKNALTLIAVVLIVLILMGPSILGGFGDLGKGIADWVKYGWDKDQNGDIDTEAETDAEAESSEGIASLNAIIQFKDGTQHTVEPEDLTFTLFPMTVFFEGKEIDRILWTLGATITWSGDVQNVRVSGTLGCWHEDSLIDKEDFSKTYGSNDITKEEWFEIQELIVTAEEIDLILPEGTHTLTVTTELLTFKATFVSGHIEQHTLGEGYAPVWEIQVTKEAETLTVLSANLQMGFYPA